MEIKASRSQVETVPLRDFCQGRRVGPGRHHSCRELSASVPSCDFVHPLLEMTVLQIRMLKFGRESEAEAYWNI